MPGFSVRRNVTVLMHLLMWGVFGFALFVFQPLSSSVTLPTEFWIKQGIFFALLVGAFYINAQILVPRLLFRDRINAYLASVIGVMAVVLLIHWGIEVYFNLAELVYKAYHPDKPVRRPLAQFRWFQPALMTTLLVMGVSTSIATVLKWQADAQLRQALEQAKTASELSFLKAQINPHFFFNTLNNIYALTLVDVEAARDALHRLSRMMRYVLYETQAGTTMLSKEIAFVQDYMQLMQLRLTDKVAVTFEQPRPLHDVPIAPMLLLPFVENAFKHGVSSVYDSRIHIGIHQHGSELSMEVRNTIFPEKTPSLEVGSGIGLTNTRRRLDLLYPDKYVLAVEEKTPENEYAVHLKLYLDGQAAPVEPMLTASSVPV
ncbi:sensor histidine kinase [Fibrisoma montanum]|uniref:Sensor histidine kinase n=1 Tax=Fibrisoma montanum TaxID=2305895 RepID=A0A418M179_9BACT|nr:histidine kinase [Fibrisoma montanum]RIV19363.1 sensor histidine kinase [Fibrisoma montanum]